MKTTSETNNRSKNTLHAHKHLPIPPQDTWNTKKKELKYKKGNTKNKKWKINQHDNGETSSRYMFNGICAYCDKCRLFQSFIVCGKKEYLKRLVLVLYGVKENSWRCRVRRAASGVTYACGFRKSCFSVGKEILACVFSFEAEVSGYYVVSLG